MKLRLEIVVDYEAANVPKAVLVDMLAAICDRAAGDGLFTGETEATVNTWEAQVTDADTDTLLWYNYPLRSV